VSDLALFIIGCAVFAVATGSALLYGYFTFYEAGVEDGLERERLIAATDDA
jgi:hypothetical protein